MIPFREWYIKKYGEYPGHQFEYIPVVLERVMNSVPEYLDEAVQEKLGGGDGR